MDESRSSTGDYDSTIYVPNISLYTLGKNNVGTNDPTNTRFLEFS